ncbi:hypothetical protein Tco_0199299 [Tanacetum coccineum]
MHDSKTFNNVFYALKEDLIYAIEFEIQEMTRGLAVGADELSPTSYLGPRAIPNLFRGGKVTSGLSALWLVESRCKGGDEVGSGMGKSGRVPDGGVPDDGVSALVWESMICGGGEW